MKVNNLILEKWQSRWDSSGQEIARKFYPTIPKGKLKTESRITNRLWYSIQSSVRARPLGKLQVIEKETLMTLVNFVWKRKKLLGTFGRNVLP